MYESIVLAVDDSEQSERAVRAAGELARLSGGKVVVLHVREHQFIVGKGGGDYDLEDRSEAEELIHRYRQTLEDSGVEVTSRAVHAAVGRVAAEIVDAANEIGADTIVMGSHGRTPVGAAVLGSNAYKVLHLTDRAVLVVR
jgi:nucleotide-binding universal stress UspA family protein